jgi:asparagine synthetase B (glutamine-hydrolysing)
MGEQSSGMCPLAVALAETPRGTIIDDCAALLEVARKISRAGYKTVAMGEAADDLFGSFKFALRYYRGSRQLPVSDTLTMDS